MIRKSILILAVSFFALAANAAIAEACPIVTGKWDVSVTSVSYNLVLNVFDPFQNAFEINIQNQDGCIIYGYCIDSYEDPSTRIPITGVIKGSSVTLSVGQNGYFSMNANVAAVINGTLINRRTMTFTYVCIGNGVSCGAGQGTGKKRIT